MQGDELHHRAHSRAGELPGAGLEHPFGPEADVFKVRGKVFMLLSSLAGEPIVTLKATPEEARALCLGYPDITPGYHMNKKHWITVRTGGEVDRGLFDDLITDSYLLVVSNLPRAQRPVDPDTFGQRTS